MSPPPNASSFANPAAPCLAAADETKWFQEEVQPHEPALRGYLQRKFPTLNEVDDVVQDSYIRLLRARVAGRLRSVRGFLFTAAHNLACDTFRRRRVVPMEVLTEAITSDALVDEANGADAAMLRQELEHLTAALRELPDRCRQVLILRRIHGLSHQEIADQLGISAHTVEKHVGVGLKRCSDYMKRHGIAPSP